MGLHSPDGPAATSAHCLRSGNIYGTPCSPPSSTGTSVEPHSGDELLCTTEPPSSSSDSDGAASPKAPVSAISSVRLQEQPFLPKPPSPLPQAVTPIRESPARDTALASSASQFIPRSVLFNGSGRGASCLDQSRIVSSIPEPVPQSERQSDVLGCGGHTNRARLYSEALGQPPEHLGHPKRPTFQSYHFRRVPPSRRPAQAPRDPSAVTILARPVDPATSLHRLPTIRLHQALLLLGPIRGSRRIKDGGIAIDFPEGTVVSKIQSPRALLGVEVALSLPATTRHRSGRIEGVPPGDSEDDLLEALNLASDGSFRVTRVQKLSRKGDHRPGPYKLVFEGSELPHQVRICSHVYPVSVYVPRAHQCSRCQRWNHQEATCRSQARCRICGQSHSGSCSSSVTPSCANCKGPHPADDRSCRFYSHEREVCRLKAEMDVPFSEARKSAGSALSRGKGQLGTAPSRIPGNNDHPRRDSNSQAYHVSGPASNTALPAGKPTSSSSSQGSRKSRWSRRRRNQKEAGPETCPSLPPLSEEQLPPPVDAAVDRSPTVSQLADSAPEVGRRPASFSSRTQPSADAREPLLRQLRDITTRLGNLSRGDPVIELLVALMEPLINAITRAPMGPCSCSSQPPRASSLHHGQ